MKKLVWIVVAFLILLGIILVKSAAAETIVIIGGWGSEPEELRFLNEKIPNSVVVIPKRNFPLADAAADLYADLYGQLNDVSGPISFVAHSWGGLLVEKLAENHPELVAKMILIATPSGGYWFAPKFLFRVEADASKDIPLFIIAGTKSAKRWYLQAVNDGTVDLISVFSVPSHLVKDSAVFELSHLELINSEEVVQKIISWLGEK